MPAVVLIAHWRGLRHGDAVSLLLARRWSNVMAVLFAVGAVSGTVLSYELGLLWPKLMGIYGPAFGIPFSVEAIWFFVEAIFTAIYLYGWRRLPAWLHWWTGVPLVDLRRARRLLRGRRERLDEPAVRVHPQPRPDHPRRPVGGDLQRRPPRTRCRT